MPQTSFVHTYDNIISIDNLLLAWKEFIIGKKSRKDVQEFERNLMANVVSLHQDLKNKTYKHSLYKAFRISDPKPRDIHKAQVRDRLLHHAIYRTLYPYFDKKFIHDSYSCRVNKGTHKAINQFRKYFRKVSQNNTHTCWVLKCDIRKFFANINHTTLLLILERYIQDKDIIMLLKNVIDSFHTNPIYPIGKTYGVDSIYAMADMKKGLPLGNLTSQLLINIYMNEFNQFIKRELKVKYYIRYADDFVILQNDKIYLEGILLKILGFLEKKLKLQLHPDKIFIKTLASGVDFLGWVHFPHHRVLRTTTKRRMLKSVKDNPKIETVQSYLGLLRHGDTYKLEKVINFE